MHDLQILHHCSKREHLVFHQIEYLGNGFGRFWLVGLIGPVEIFRQNVRIEEFFELELLRLKNVE